MNIIRKFKLSKGVRFEKWQTQLACFGGGWVFKGIVAEKPYF